MTIGVKNPEEMSKNGLPDTKLKFMKKVWGEEAIKIKFKTVKALRKLREGILVEKCKDSWIVLNKRKTYTSRDC